MAWNRDIVVAHRLRYAVNGVTADAHDEPAPQGPYYRRAPALPVRLSRAEWLSHADGSLKPLYHFWHFLKLGGKRRALFSAVTLGLSQLAKYSCVYLYPIFLVIAALYCRFRPAPDIGKHGRWHGLTWNLRRWSIVIVLFAAVSIVTINLGFDFSGTGTPLSRYTFKDPLFKKLQATPIIGKLPLPLPMPYVQGLDLVKFEERMGQAWGNIYMAGQLRVNHHDGTLHGFPGYFFYAALFKVPIAKQVIFLVALFGYFSRRSQAAIRA